MNLNIISLLKFKVEKPLVVGIYVGGENYYDRTVASRGHEYTKKAFQFGNKKSICHFLYGKQNNAKNNGKDELTGILNKIARWFSIYFLEYKDDYEKRAFKNGLMILEQESIMVEQK